MIEIHQQDIDDPKLKQKATMTKVSTQALGILGQLLTFSTGNF